MGLKDGDVVYRVVEEGSEYRLSGYRNATGLYSTLAGARRAKSDQEKYQQRMTEYRERAGKEPVQCPAVKLQKSRLVWEGVE